MSSRNFYVGILGGGNGNLVGIPKKLIGRISNYYTTLKENISAETTSIQIQFNTCSPSEYEKLYVKNLLYNTLEQQLSETMAQTLKLINSFRDSQNKVSTTIDKLNFITSNSYDGQYINPNGGRVVAFQLTGLTSTTLVNSYTSSTSYFNSYITNNVNTAFTKNYPGSEEYIFFSPLMYTNESIAFTFAHRAQLEELLKYRKSILYDNLLNNDPQGITGLSSSTKFRFKTKLNNIIIPWINYDTSLMTQRFTNNLEGGYKTLESVLNRYYSDFDVGYSINTGVTAENLVRINLRDKNIGISDAQFNFKTLSQLYVS